MREEYVPVRVAFVKFTPSNVVLLKSTPDNVAPVKSEPEKVQPRKSVPEAKLEYDLVGTYDLSLTIFPDPRPPGEFPAAAATYKVVAIFDNGTPHVQTLNMPGTTVKTLPPVVFPGVPLGGGNVTINVGFMPRIKRS
jgi:hypothetical protein